MKARLLMILVLLLVASCGEDAADGGAQGSDADVDTDGDGDTDSDSDSDADADSDTDADTDTFLELPECEYRDSDGCHEGDLVVTSDGEMGALVGLPCVSGTLLVSVDGLEDLELPMLKKVCNLAVVENEALESMALDALVSVDGDLYLSENRGLADISMASLIRVEGDFYLLGDDVIETMAGFPALEIIGGSMHLWSLDDLPSLDGLSNLEEVGGALDLQHCHSMVSLDGLDGLHTLAGGFGVQSSWALSDICALSGVADWSGGITVRYSPIGDIDCLSGLENMTRIAGLYLSETMITSLESLSSLTTVDVSLELNDNSELESLSSLSGLVSVGDGLRIVKCPQVEELAFPDLQDVGNLIVFDGNDSVTSI